MRCKWLVGPLLCMLALCAVLAGPAFTVRAEDADERRGGPEDGGIRMDVTYGYGNHARGGRYVPVGVALENVTGAGFAGSLEFLTMESDHDIYRYQYPVEVEAETEKDLHVYIPMGNRADQMFVSLSDPEGRQIVRERIRLNFSLDVPELFVGILSDTPDRLAAWNGLNIDYGMIRTTAVDFDAETFPTDEMGLDVIDVILISNFRIRDLSSEQSRVLIQWVRSGGTMILGTGMRADDTLGRFAPELLEESYEMPEVREVDMGTAYAQENPSESVLSLPCVDFSLSGGDILLSDEEQTLVASVPYGRGTIAVAAYDFTDIDQFCRLHPAYLDDLLTGILGESRITGLAQAVYSGNSDSYWSVRDMINTGDVRRLPNMSLYTLEIAIYVFLAGLAWYVFLKQRDLTEYYRWGVIALSLLFTTIIYVMSSGTRFTGTFYTYARFLETTSDSIGETSYMNIRAPYSHSYEADIPPDYAVKPITRSFYEDSAAAPGFTGSEDCQIDISLRPDGTVITVLNVPAFEPRYFQLNKVTENTEGIGFYGDLLVNRGALSGSITNAFDAAVDDCALLFNNRLIRLGTMEPGQTVTIDELEAVEYPQNYSYQVAAYLSGESVFEQADIGNEEYVDATEKTKLLKFYLDNHMPSYYGVSVGRVVGVMRTADEDGSRRKGGSVQGNTVVSSAVSVYSSEDEVLYRSALAKTPKVLGGSYDQEYNILYGMDPVTLEYSLGNDIHVESLFFDYVSEVFTADGSGDDLVSFEGSIYFYNHNTGAFDEMDPQKREYEDYQLVGYLSPGNTITIRYVYANMNQYNWNVLLPVLNIVGREY